ncbi:MAG: serine hydrolase domain-containing protein [Chitinophagaceae bacterium]
MKILITAFTLIIYLSSVSFNNDLISINHRKSDTTKLPNIDTGKIAKIQALGPFIEKVFTEYAKQNHIPGLAYGIVVDGKLAISGSYGYTDTDKKILATTSSVFRIASMSKSFTAMAILKLRDEGKLQLDDPAYLYIPEMKGLKYLTTDAPLITVRHLLTHGAGFPEDNPWGDRQLADSDKELSELIENQISFSNPPGVDYEYSNLGFAMLGRIITRVSGKSYQQYIKENIWLPLGMKNATWEYAEVPANKLAHGYRWLNDQWIEEELLHDKADGSWGAMGGMLCSVEEFVSYMNLHLSAWPPSSLKETGPVKRSSVREMHHPWRFNGMNTRYRYPDGRTCALVTAYGYGLGWNRDCDGKIFIAHSGGLPGFGSQWRIMPDYGIGIVSLANRTYSPMGGINTLVLDSLIKMAKLKPEAVEVSPILNKRKNELLKILPNWDNAEKSGLFAENFFPDYPIDSLRKQSKELFTKAGKIISVKEMIAENNLRGTFVLEGEKINIEVYFTLSPENPPLIQQYRMREIKK